jgi:predicted RNA-binding protein YlqC (UPF0109 family)
LALVVSRAARARAQADRRGVDRRRDSPTLARLSRGASGSRRRCGSRANIDHIAICRTGIYAIDAKRYAGKVQRIDKGGWFSTDLRLYVGRRDCTKLVGRMGSQVKAIRSALGEAVVQEVKVDVKAALCFVGAE